MSSREDGNQSNFRNIVFSSYLEFLTVDKVHTPSVIHHHHKALDSKNFPEQHTGCLTGLSIDNCTRQKQTNSVVLVR
jgi:hypothetical protein